MNAIARDHSDPANFFYVATDIGVFYTDNAGKTWKDLTIPYGLPGVQVTDLAAFGGYLHAVTFGRGIWRSSYLTDVTLGATSLHNNVFAFVKGLDKRIYLNQAQFGHAFSGWFPVQ